jgi:hypothetical protein
MPKPPKNRCASTARSKRPKRGKRLREKSCEGFNNACPGLNEQALAADGRYFLIAARLRNQSGSSTLPIR